KQRRDEDEERDERELAHAGASTRGVGWARSRPEAAARGQRRARFCPPAEPEFAPLPTLRPEISQRARGIEMARRQIDAIGLELLEEVGAQPAGAKAAVNVAGVIGRFLHEPIDFLHLDGFAL